MIENNTNIKNKVGATGEFVDDQYSRVASASNNKSNKVSQFLQNRQLAGQSSANSSPNNHNDSFQAIKNTIKSNKMRKQQQERQKEESSGLVVTDSLFGARSHSHDSAMFVYDEQAPQHSSHKSRKSVAKTSSANSTTVPTKQTTVVQQRARSNGIPGKYSQGPSDMVNPNHVKSMVQSFENRIMLGSQNDLREDNQKSPVFLNTPLSKSNHHAVKEVFKYCISTLLKAIFLY